MPVHNYVTRLAWDRSEYMEWERPCFGRLLAVVVLCDLSYSIKSLFDGVRSKIRETVDRKHFDWLLSVSFFFSLDFQPVCWVHWVPVIALFSSKIWQTNSIRHGSWTRLIQGTSRKRFKILKQKCKLIFYSPLADWDEDYSPLTDWDEDKIIVTVGRWLRVRNLQHGHLG